MNEVKSSTTISFNTNPSVFRGMHLFINGQRHRVESVESHTQITVKRLTWFALILYWLKTRLFIYPMRAIRDWFYLHFSK